MGFFDGINIAKSGILTSAKRMEVTSNNIANAANEKYSRQVANSMSLFTHEDGGLIYGQGVSLSSVQRIRDELLDATIRETSSEAGTHSSRVQWMSRLENIWAEPGDDNIGTALSAFWSAWQDLGLDPDNYAMRESLLTKTKNLVAMINSTDEKLVALKNDLNQSLKINAGKLDTILKSIASANENIYTKEAGGSQQANDMRDERDALLQDLSKLVNFTSQEDASGSVNVFIGGEPAVQGSVANGVTTKVSPIDGTIVNLHWTNGGRVQGITEGEIEGALFVRDTVIEKYQGSLDTFANTLISQTNGIYANGIGQTANTTLTSRLGYAALGVPDSSTSLDIFESGGRGQINITFYNSSNEAVRQEGVLIDSNDSMDDIVTKLNGISGLTASLVTDSTGTGKLNLTIDTAGAALGETRFAISNNTGGYDTSGFLDLLGFDTGAKSTNTSAAAPTLTSGDLTDLLGLYGVTTQATLQTTALGLQGSFTINAFETALEDAGKTNGSMLQQLRIAVTSTDTINSIVTKINNLTATHGVSASIVGTTMRITHASKTNTEGNLSGAGTLFLRLGFANEYRYPAVAGDEPPPSYNGRGDSTGIFSTMQMNTLFEGDDAGSMKLDTAITLGSQLHASFKLSPGGNDMSIAMAALQNTIVNSDQFTISNLYENMIADVGKDTDEYKTLSESAQALLEGYTSERANISGVNLDEELSNMLLYQRSYEANARMLSVISEMLDELFKI